MGKRIASNANATNPAKTPSPATAKPPMGKAPIAKVPITKAAIGKAPIVKAPIGKAPIAKLGMGKSPMAKAPAVDSRGSGKAPVMRQGLEFEQQAVQAKLKSLNTVGLWQGPHPLDEAALASLLSIDAGRALEILDEAEE